MGLPATGLFDALFSLEGAKVQEQARVEWGRFKSPTVR